jgi:4-amino-4-deoxy-L-arabinose transferase-like glycosyltransferase
MDQDGQHESGRWAPWTAVAIVLLFLAACVPLAIWQFFTVNMDEPRYTVAAAEMMATGDYLVPTNPWGGVRLLKPPLSYYYVVGGFSLFGQSLFGAKLFWLLSAGAILGFTWALARRIGASQVGAAVAVAALAANLHFYRAALTHIPDIPQMLGITMALVGFARILAAREGEEAPPWACYLAWVGIAFAFFAKGLLALVLVALTVAMRVQARGVGRPGRHETAAIVIAVIVGGWWYVLMAIRKPELLFQQFLGDQVTKKASFDIGWILETFVENAIDLVQGFVPFLIAAVPFALARLRVRPRREVLFLMLWCLVVVVVFCFGADRTERYMLPAMPALAALIGLGFSGLSGEDIARRSGRTVRILLPLFAIVGLLTAGVVYAGSTVLAAVAVLLGFAVAICAVWWLAGVRRPGVSLTVLALLPAVALLSIFPAYDYIGKGSMTDLSVEAIEAAGVRPDEVVFLRRWQLVERVGLRIPPIEDYRFTRRPEPDQIGDARLAITTDPETLPGLEALGFEMVEKVGSPGGFPFGEFLDAIVARDFGPLRDKWGERIWIGLRTAETPAGG